MEGERKEGGEFRRKMEEVMEGVLGGGRIRERGRERSGSTGILEMWKRKRAVAEGLEDVGGKEKRDNVICFQKSKKTSRSPIRKGE